MMSIFKKIRQLLSLPKRSKPASPKPDKPISQELTAWLDECGWRYKHDMKGSVHHLMAGFSDHTHDWTFVILVNEDSGVVSMLGILEQTVPASYYLQILTALAQMNLVLVHGSLGFDGEHGEAYAKLTINTRFGAINKEMLDYHLQMLAELVVLTKDTVQTVLTNGDIDELIAQKLGDDVVPKSDEITTFFLPTRTYQ